MHIDCAHALRRRCRGTELLIILQIQYESYLTELLMFPELVFQDVLYGLHIMICSPLHLHRMAAWKPSYMHSFHKPSQVQQTSAIASLKVMPSTSMMVKRPWHNFLAHLLHLQRLLQAKVPQEIIKELVCVTAEGWYLLYLRSWQMSL